MSPWEPSRLQPILAMIRRSLLAFAFAGLSASASMADVLDVDAGVGPYFEIADAVIAASPGDVVRVASGTYGFFGLIGKGVTVVAASETEIVRVTGLVRVQSLPNGQRGVLDGLDLEAGLLVYGNAGPVHLQGLDVRGVIDAPWRTTAEIHSSDRVTVAGCQFDAGAYGGGMIGGEYALRVQQCGTVDLVDCAMIGSECLTDFGGAGCTGGTACFVESSTRVRLSGCHMVGGAGSAGDSDCYDCSTFGPCSPFGFECYECRNGYGGSGLALGMGQTLSVVERESTFVPGVTSVGQEIQCVLELVEVPPIDDLFSPATVTHLPGRRSEISVAGLWSAAGSQTLELRGTPGRRAFVRAQGIRTVGGGVLQPGGGTVIAARPAARLVGVIPASGLLQATYEAPSLAPLEQRQLVLQAFLVDGVRRERSPSFVVEVLGSGF